MENNESVENRKVFRFLGAEVVFFLILFVSIALIFNYFNVFPLSKISPGLFGFLPNQATPTQVQSKASVVPSRLNLEKKNVSNPTLDVSSQVQGVNLEVLDKNELINLLQEWGIYGIPVFNEQSKGQQHIELIRLRLVEKEQPLDKVKTPDGNTYLSSNVTASENSSVLVEIYIDKNILEKRTSEAGNFFQSQFLRTMYFQQANINTPQKDFKTLEQEAIEKLQELGKQGKKFFEIRKI